MLALMVYWLTEYWLRFGFDDFGICAVLVTSLKVALCISMIWPVLNERVCYLLIGYISLCCIVFGCFLLWMFVDVGLLELYISYLLLDVCGRIVIYNFFLCWWFQWESVLGLCNNVLFICMSHSISFAYWFQCFPSCFLIQHGIHHGTLMGLQNRSSFGRGLTM